MFGEIDAISAKFEQPTPVQRSSVKPTSLSARSLHPRSTCVPVIVVAVRPPGATGRIVFAVPVAEYGEAPTKFTARTRYEYVSSSTVAESVYDVAPGLS